MRLKNKIALITGSSKGIGATIAKKFAEEGAAVIINYKNSEEKALRLTKSIKDKGLEAIAIKADVSEPEEIISMSDEIIIKFGRIDILVNNASLYPRNKFFDSTEESWNSAIDTNLKGAYFCSQIFSKEMLKKKQGNIINISSNTGLMPRDKKGLEYGISKAGLIYLTQSLALTLAPNIRVNCIAPGYTLTEMVELYRSPTLKKQVESRIPLRKINLPEDIANSALFLASEDARNITGQIMVVDGGYSLR